MLLSKHLQDYLKKVRGMGREKGDARKVRASPFTVIRVMMQCYYWALPNDHHVHSLQPPVPGAAYIRTMASVPR